MSGEPVLYRGIDGHEQWVEFLQQHLAHRTGTELRADGDFGPHTEHLVTRFQESTGTLTANGRVEEDTWAALLNGDTSGEPAGDTASGAHHAAPHVLWDHDAQTIEYDPSRDVITLRLINAGGPMAASESRFAEFVVVHEDGHEDHGVYEAMDVGAEDWKGRQSITVKFYNVRDTFGTGHLFLKCHVPDDLSGDRAELEVKVVPA